MRKIVAASVSVAGVLIVLNATAAFAHRVDEYLQAVMIDVTKDHVQLELRLAPGIAVASTVLDSIDISRDGVLSPAEQDVYVQRVLSALTLAVDGNPVMLRATSQTFDEVGALKRGTGTMRFRFEGTVRAESGAHRLTLTNRHRTPISAYLVNALEPTDRDIHVVKQERSDDQSRYELSYDQGTLISFGQLLRWGLVVAALLILAGNCVAAYRRRLVARRARVQTA